MDNNEKKCVLKDKLKIEIMRYYVYLCSLKQMRL